MRRRIRKYVCAAFEKRQAFSRIKNSRKWEEVEEEVDCQLSNWLDYAIVQQQKHFFRAIVRVY